MSRRVCKVNPEDPRRHRESLQGKPVASIGPVPGLSLAIKSVQEIRANPSDQCHPWPMRTDPTDLRGYHIFTSVARTRLFEERDRNGGYHSASVAASKATR